MLAKVWFILKYWFCWILFFEVARIGFILTNLNEVENAGLRTSLLSLWYGIRMDMSTAAYITLPVALAVLISVFLKPFRNAIIYKIYTTIVLFLVLLILVADIGLFKAWGSRIDATPLKYLSNPKEAWASVNHLPIFSILIVFLLVYLLLVLWSNKLILKWLPVLKVSQKKWLNFILILLLTGLFIIPIRGGFQLAPLNQSSVYFSKNNFANLAALNAPWNFLQSISQNTDYTINPFRVDDDAKVKVVTDSLFEKKGSSAQLIDLGKGAPLNVILIVWESLTSKAVGLQMEGKMITPGMNELKKEGIYFSDIYATGDRTDKGIVGVLSGYPSQATTSVIKEPGKAAKLPMLSKIFAKRGYNTTFHYGGELEFANMKAYLLQGAFNQFTTIDDFDKKDQNSKWGAHDGVVAAQLKKDINNSPRPFFSTWLTLSSHEPYEIPSAPILKGKNDIALFLSSIHYTDSIVYSFIQFAKQQSWWNNTLVVIVADHGHRLPRSIHKPDDFKIPLLMLGGAVKSATIISTIGSQTDLAATLLGELNLPSNEFIWSRNLLDSSRSPWAFFTFNNGFGFIQPNKKLVFDNVGKLSIDKIGNISDEDIYRGRAIQQAAFQDYLNK